MNRFVILPHQLYDPKLLPNAKLYILWEHPHYFKSFNYNKKKLVLHRASMRYYYDVLKKDNKVLYVPFNKKIQISTYTMFDPIDLIKLSGKPTMIESPGFLLTKEHYAIYRKKTDKFLFNNFYMWGKSVLDMMPDVKSTDKMNRRKMPSGVKVPKVPSNTKDQEYIKEAAMYVNKHFPNNYGTTDNFMFPVTHVTARKWMRDFIKYKLNNFGPYQDAIVKDNNTLFHSLLSTSINIGLLTPDQVSHAVMAVPKVPLNSCEAFIRQLFWREYQRYCYIYINWSGKNYFGNTKKLGREWYDGTTGIPPVDDCITRAFDTGYLHHIERLMVVGNYMNLSGISPKEGFKWFMEFSCDSYLWVMHQNVYDMVFFVTGGLTMRRPYMSSSNYVLKMSDYPKGDWCDTWDTLYRNFLKKHRKKLHKFRYYYGNV